MPIEYILLGVGIVLLGIEAVVPGFGFFGVTGLISLLAGSYYLLDVYKRQPADRLRKAASSLLP